MSISGIAIQFIGIVIDQVVAADAKKFAKPKEGEDSKPLLAGAAPVGKNDLDSLEKIGKGYDDDLNGQLPKQAKTQ